MGIMKKLLNMLVILIVPLDKEPRLSYQEAKDIWINRNIEMKKQNEIQILDYSNLHIWDDDGYPSGSATLTILDRGKKAKVYTSFGYIRREGEWKITNISAREDDDNLRYIWTNIISAKMK